MQEADVDPPFGWIMHTFPFLNASHVYDDGELPCRLGGRRHRCERLGGGVEGHGGGTWWLRKQGSAVKVVWVATMLQYAQRRGDADMKAGSTRVRVELTRTMKH